MPDRQLQSMRQTGQLQARIEHRGSFAGTGCLVQGAGILLGGLIFFFIPVAGRVLGPLVAIALLWSGSRQALKYDCGHCHNPIASIRVRVCPSCHAQLTWRGR